MAIPAGEYPHRVPRFRSDLNPWSGVVLALVGVLAIGAAGIAADVMNRSALRTHRNEVAPVIAGPRVDQDGAWERSEVDPPFAVEDLQSTSFGLVAATGPDGVWISQKGLHWEQSLATLDAPDSGSVMGAVKAVIEFDSALYAFGNVSSGTGTENRAWLVGWRSVDGDTWEQITVADGWDQIMDVTAGSEGLTLFTRARSGLTGGECCVAALYRSGDGENWRNLSDDLIGLDDVQIWAATSFGEGYLALGSSRSRDAVFSSSNGITWQVKADWQDAGPALWRSLDLHESAWSIVDMFEGPDSVMAVIYSGRHRGIVLLTSTDGTEFHAFDASNDLLKFEDKRANDWPPLTAPEGAIHDGHVVLLGEWYPESANAPCTHFWRWTQPEAEDSPAPSPNRSRIAPPRL